MKAIFPAGLVLVCLLSVFNWGSAMAAATPDKAVSSTSTTKVATTTPVKKVAPVKTPGAAKKPVPRKPRPPIAAKSKPASDVVRTTELPSTNIDLSLPPEMVRQLQPIGTVPIVKRAPLLPPLFGEKPKEESKFQLNGRLISNEMQLQLRNEERREVEGAALEFQFIQ
ncbi:translation initiation factor 2 [Pseudomonas sp. RA_35y_Pfl2_P32]|uniref:translation initiation factor 2 n=1 Tax=Pseudomonas sp. RA_35y_Pfl2_P32 TaxID=3088705 RepID=UPI0030DB3B55